MAEANPIPPPRPTTTSSSTTNPQISAGLRSRFNARQDSRNAVSRPLGQIDPHHQSKAPNSSLSPPPPELLRRRSSILSDTTQSLDEIINPSTSRRRSSEDDGDNEVTHWHSTPLLFALLPAVGGLFFKEGSSFVTDVLLLGLAAVFMNWSIRIPWDWYYSAQALRRDVEPPPLRPGQESIPEEPDENALETASSGGESPSQQPADGHGDKAVFVRSKREDAAADLRVQEIMAFAATFIFPALAAYLLHVIRAQLSRPSNSLVSDYNLSIFLLAAEVRPARQLIRLIANRTLHLQRTVTGLDDPFAATVEERSTTRKLEARIAELEAKLSGVGAMPSSTSVAQKTDIVNELSSEMRKRYEPRLEGLERAVRRYEKRSTTLAMLTEQRLNSLETRLQDALSLAAVAAQHSQRKASIVAYVLETISLMVAWPMKLAWRLVMWPFILFEEGYSRLKALMLEPKPSNKPSKRKQASRDVVSDERPKAKTTLSRKVSR